MEIFGLFGFILLGCGILWLVDQARYKQCHKCREKINAGAEICPHCRSELAYPRRS
jgi:predicted amidophosphoribosyltransferase